VRDYSGRHPGPADVALVVEIADESLLRDRGEKLAIYAAAGIAEYWIVNLLDRTLEVYRKPKPVKARARAGYAARRVYKLGAACGLKLDRVQLGAIDVAAIMP
jgi:Uma2 family endonuclease